MAMGIRLGITVSYSSTDTTDATREITRHQTDFCFCAVIPVNLPFSWTDQWPLEHKTTRRRGYRQRRSGGRRSGRLNEDLLELPTRSSGDDLRSKTMEGSLLIGHETIWTMDKGNRVIKGQRLLVITKHKRETNPGRQLRNPFRWKWTASWALFSPNFFQIRRDCPSINLVSSRASSFWTSPLPECKLRGVKGDAMLTATFHSSGFSSGISTFHGEEEIHLIYRIYKRKNWTSTVIPSFKFTK